MNYNPNRRKRLIAFSFLSVLFTLILAIGLTLSNIGFKPTLTVRGGVSDYSITLDSANKVTSAGDKVQKTKLGNDVTFTYENVQNSTTGHVTLTSSGTIVNKDHIRSIQSITATFDVAESLKFKVSFDGETVGKETVMESGYTYQLGSDPYYVHFSTTKQVTISQIVITYSCVENPNAHEGEETGDGLIGVIDFWNSANAGNTDGNSVVNETYVDNHSYDKDSNPRTSIDLVDNVSATAVYQDRYGGIGLSKSKGGGNLQLTLSEGIEPTTVRVIAGSQSPTKTLSLNDVSKDVTKNCTNITALNDTYTNTLEWTFENAPSTLEFDVPTNSSKLAIYRIYLIGQTGPEIQPPEESIIGFSASDSKANSYYSDEAYDAVNGLSVYANKTGGESFELSKGGEDGYSYVVYNSVGNAIDSSNVFGTEGTYTVVVSYKNFIPVEIQISVGFHVVLTGIEVVSEHTIFNTAQKLSDYTSGITVNLTYNRESENEEGVPYSSFASKGLALTLLNPSDVTYSISTVFGTAGTWKIKVASTSNPSTYGTLNITVNSIPVTGITVSGSKASIEVDEELQLTASVVPNNATTQTVTWGIASATPAGCVEVNTNGLVTGKAVGTARVTATANDGSAVFGYIDLTITKKTVVPTTSDVITASDLKATGTSYTDFSGVTKTSDAIYAGNSAKSNAGAIQLRTSSNTGIISTTSGGNIKEVIVSWSLIPTDRALQVYGSTTPYTSIGNLFASTPQGTLLGTIDGTSPTSLKVSGSYQYVGVRPDNGSIYISSVEFVWAEPAAPTPVYPESISLTGNQSIGIGETSQLTVNYAEGVNVKNATFASANEAIATVDTDGLVTGVGSGTTTITATAEAANSTTVEATISITVSPIAVSSVTLSEPSLSMKVGQAAVQLTATISPSNATNKNVTWSVTNANPANCVSVTNGLVSALAVGTAKVKVTTVDGNKSAECTVTVTAAPTGGADIIDNAATSSYLSNTGTSAWADDFTLSMDNANYYIHSMGTTGGSHALQWNKNGYLYSTANNENNPISSIEIVATSGKQMNIYLSNTAFSSNSGNGSENGSITGTGTYTPSGEYKYVRIAGTASSTVITSITINYGTPTPISPESISISPSSVELTANGSKPLTVNYYSPLGTVNQDKDVTWSKVSGGSSKISVSSTGTVSADSNATAGVDTATIKATLVSDSSITATCEVSIVETQNAKHTILLYLCGSDLESDLANEFSYIGADGKSHDWDGQGFAAKDIIEIIGCNKPDDVNVVICTGGSTEWTTNANGNYSAGYSISNSKIQYHHVEGHYIVKDKELTYASMGLTSTLQAFITYGLEEYPADKTGLILWNHGGAMGGVCADRKSDDNLSNYEVHEAVKNSFTSVGRDTSNKLEWIGYDACLMGVADIACTNADYFNYMVASEELEGANGWAYDDWLPTLYNNISVSTVTLLDKICQTFVDFYNIYGSSSNDSTLAAYDLSKASTFVSAFNTWSSNFTTPSHFNTLKTAYQNSLKFGYDEDCEGYLNSVVDAKDFVTKVKNQSAFSSVDNSALLTAISQLVISSTNTYGGYYNSRTKPCGVTIFFAGDTSLTYDGDTYPPQTKKAYYSTDNTKFTHWSEFNLSNGKWFN